MKATIINIGDELLNGTSVNTNATWLCGRLNEYGATISQVLIIGDQKTDIINALEEACGKVDLVFISGGLGPTSDDRTKEAALDFFGGTLQPHAPSIANIQRLFEDRGMPLTERNIQQGWIPDNAIVYPNHVGTAPGMGFQKRGSTYIFLPGVPAEMKGIINNHIESWMNKSDSSEVFVMNEIVITGIPESHIADKLESWQQQIPEWLSLAYLPSAGLVKIRLSCRHSQPDYVRELTSRLLGEAIKLFPGSAYFTRGQVFDQWFFEQLVRSRKTIATAESCTGGYLAHRITSHPGSSSVFKGSIVAYHNDIKEQLLGVSRSILEKHGAVSEEVVRIMAQRIRELFHTDLGVAISGIAGPDGGTEEKPVGTVWIAAATEKEIVTKHFLMGTNRLRNIEKSAISAMQMTLNLIFTEQPL